MEHLAAVADFLERNHRIDTRHPVRWQRGVDAEFGLASAGATVDALMSGKKTTVLIGAAWAPFLVSAAALSWRAQVPQKKWISGPLLDSDWARLAEALQELDRHTIMVTHHYVPCEGIVIVDSDTLSLQEARAVQKSLEFRSAEKVVVVGTTDGPHDGWKDFALRS